MCTAAAVGLPARVQHQTMTTTPMESLLATARAGTRTLVMGVLNVTPDSFYDGGAHQDPVSAVDHAMRMLESGADIVDVGGESTRPGSEPVDAEVELARILPVIERLTERANAAISVDTTKSCVAAAALAAGATMVNDVSAMTRDPRMAEVVAAHGAAVCLMHMRGTPATMQLLTDYKDVVTEVRSWLSERVRAAEAAGIPRERIVVDPGFGFAKTVDQNLELVRRLRELSSLGCPVLLGPSRKSTIGAVLGGLPVHQRLEGTAAVVALAIANGAAIVRVHDVLEMTRVARMTDAIVRST